MLPAQVAKAEPSRLHSNVEFDSVDEKTNVADDCATAPDGPLLMIVSGAVRSIVHVHCTCD
jgi:hypothetical protein